MKYRNILIGTLGLLAAQSAFSFTCFIEANEMAAHISTYGSISTPGCPLNRLGAGINSVTDTTAAFDRKTCYARCKYASGVGSSGRDCTWKIGNWINTLTCRA